MDQFPIIVLDEYCDGLLNRVGDFAPTEMFKRAAGYLSDPEVAANELHQKLSARGHAGPYIIVSPSFGSYTALLYASKYPEFVGGLILLDPSHPRQGTVALEVLPSEEAILSPTILEFRAKFAGFGPVWDEGCRQVSRISSLGDIPLIILAAGRPEAPLDLPRHIYERLVKDRHSLLEGYAKLSSLGEVRILSDVGHGIAVEAPDLVCAVISEVFIRLKVKLPNQ